MFIEIREGRLVVSIIGYDSIPLISAVVTSRPTERTIRLASCISSVNFRTVRLGIHFIL